ncbi:MAG: DUF1799 domain-containing protein [Bradyrhizobium sp.]|uniref:DUF1799 domain-containing protein n=1 Tax=Bradyrhizobium sp. TaxID=376 RepID=UPI003D10D9DF
MPESDPAVGLYLRCQTQWQYSGMGQRTGLNYAGVEAVARLTGAPESVEAFAGLQVIEREFMQVDMERAERDRKK